MHLHTSCPKFRHYDSQLHVDLNKAHRPVAETLLNTPNAHSHLIQHRFQLLDRHALQKNTPVIPARLKLEQVFDQNFLDSTKKSSRRYNNKSEILTNQRESSNDF